MQKANHPRVCRKPTTQGECVNGHREKKVGEIMQLLIVSEERRFIYEKRVSPFLARSINFGNGKAKTKISLKLSLCAGSFVGNPLKTLLKLGVNISFVNYNL